MGDFEDKLESILNNPHAMQQIMSLAQSLGVGNSDTTPPPTVEPCMPPSSPTEPTIDPQMLSGIISLLSQYNKTDDQRVALLAALRPFVSEKRYIKIDRAIQIAKLSRVARTAFEMFKKKEDEDHV